MKLLIAVKSCEKHRVAGYNSAIRKTWGKKVEYPATLIFFQGPAYVIGDSKISLDEYPLPVIDDYDHLPDKTISILNTFLSTPFDYIFLCDTDTFIIPSKLLTCGFDKYDVSGRYGEHPQIGTTFEHRDDRNHTINPCHPWPSGGVGYFLSKKAAKIIVDTPYQHWAEDFMVGQITGPHIIEGRLTAADLPEFEAQTSWHFQRRMYSNLVYDLKFGWMQRMYQEHLCT